MKLNKVKFTAVLSLLLLVTSGHSALAQGNNPYWFMYMGQSLLYPLSRTIGLPFMYGPYNANPLYSANSYLRTSNSFPNVYPFTNATYGPWGYRNAGMLPGYNWGGNGSGNNQAPTIGAQDEPDSANPAANTMNSVNPYQSPPQSNPGKPAAFVPSSGGTPAGPVSGLNTPVAAMPPTTPPSASPAFSSNKAATAPATTPGVAPPAVAPAALAPPIPGQSIGRPLAEGFINHLNGNYQGDMAKALSNTDTRSWARAMGIIGDDVQDGSHLSSDRLEVIDRLLKDTSLDPVSKLDTMRILLKKSTTSGN